MSRQKIMSSLVIIILGFGTIFSNLTIFAQTLLPQGSIFISEINWDGSWLVDKDSQSFKSDSLDEWIEFYNPSDTIVSLGDVVIKGAASSGKDLLYKEESVCQINPKSYLIVSRLATSPTLNGLEVCQATNMSLSNSSLNISISDKDGGIIESQFIGNPSTLINDKNPDNKYSIEKHDDVWIQSSSKLDLIGHVGRTDQSYHHFASPGHGILEFEISTGKTVSVESFPFEMSPSITSKEGLVLNKVEFGIKTLDCNFNPSEYHDSIVLDEVGNYCVKARFEVMVGELVFTGFIESLFEVVGTGLGQPSQGKIQGVEITEIDLLTEKIEFYNSNTFPVDLNQLTLEDTTGSVKKVTLNSLVLRPKEYTILETSKLGITLNNDGDNLILRGAEQGIVAQTKAPMSKTLENGKTWQYFNDVGLWEKHLETLGRNNLRSEILLTVPDDKKDELEVSSGINSNKIEYYAEKLKINEISPQGDEYIELINKSELDLDLSGLVLRDMKGRVSKIILEKNTTLPKKSYLVVPLKGKISLNNDGDGVVIMTTEGDVVDQVSYDFAREKNQSYQFFETGWSWESTTENTENNKTIKSPEESEIEDKMSEKQSTNEICQDMDILVRATKNTYFTSEGKIYLENVPTETLPRIANICKIKPRDDYKQGVFKVWVKPSNLKPVNFGDNVKKIDEFSLVNYSLACKGKKNADVVRDDVVFRASYQIQKPECVNSRVYGLGLVFTLDGNYILYHVGQSNQAPVNKKLETTKQTLSKQDVLVKNSKTDNDKLSQSFLDLIIHKKQHQIITQSYEQINRKIDIKVISRFVGCYIRFSVLYK